MLQKIMDYMNNHIVYFDGAMGTMVQKHGLKAGENPELFSLTHPEIIAQIHHTSLLLPGIPLRKSSLLPLQLLKNLLKIMRMLHLTSDRSENY